MTLSSVTLNGHAATAATLAIPGVGLVQWGSASSSLTTPDGGSTAKICINNNGGTAQVGLLGVKVTASALSPSDFSGGWS